MDESFEPLGSSWAAAPGPMTPPSMSLTPSEMNAAEPFRPPSASVEDTPSVASDARPTSGEHRPKETRLAALAAAQARRDSARKEVSRLRTIMEDVLDEESEGNLMDEMNARPAEYLNSRRPIFRKVAAAIKEEKDAAAQIAEVEQEIRDHSMSPADMLVEVRSLIRKQNTEFEAMRAENAGLVERVATLEHVVKLLVSLPQISRSASDVCAFAQTEVEHRALQGNLKTLTLLQHAAQQRDLSAIDYLLSSESTLEEHALVVLNPPESCRTYEVPKQTSESSVLGQEAKWAPFKSSPNAQKSWLQLDAGRVVNLMGWHMETDSGVHPRERSVIMEVSSDGETWQRIPTEMAWRDFKTYFVPAVCSANNGNGFTNAQMYSAVQGLGAMPHTPQFYLAQCCIAYARYFRILPHTVPGQSGWNKDSHTLRFGLVILDDGGDHLVGPRFVRDLSPLHTAAKTGDTELIRKLLDHGADPEMLAGCWQPTFSSPLQGGKTALQLAASSASLEAVQILVDRGAKVHKDQFEVPTGKDGDLVAGFLQTNGSKPVKRT